MSHDVTDEEVNAAKSVIRRSYYQWVNSTANDLVRQFFDEIEGGSDELYDRLNEVVDSAMTYTSDQYMVIFASESSDEGLQEAQDLGGELNNNFVAQWAFLTFQIDVREALDRNDLLHDGPSDASREERIAWLIEEHGNLFYRKGGTEAYLIGTVNEGQTDEIDLGVLLMKKGEPAFVSSTSIAKAKHGEDLAVALDALHSDQQARFIEAK